MPIGYHFHNGKTLRDGRPLPEIGHWLEHSGQIVMCKSGLHGSDDPFDALQYAPGPWLDLVEYDGDIERQTDKWVARRRRTIKRVDLTDTLRYFARMQALSAIMSAPANVPDVVLDWLMTGDESLKSAAESAAWSAAWSAAESAARSAAESAARSVASYEFSILVNEAFECCNVT